MSFPVYKSVNQQYQAISIEIFNAADLTLNPGPAQPE